MKKMSYIAINWIILMGSILFDVHYLIPPLITNTVGIYTTKIIDHGFDVEELVRYGLALYLLYANVNDGHDEWLINPGCYSFIFHSAWIIYKEKTYLGSLWIIASSHLLLYPFMRLVNAYLVFMQARNIWVRIQNR